MIELLSPAGDLTALRAAILNGADAVYLGGQALNARRGAGNFDADGLRRAAGFCHERGRKLYVTVNTLVKQAELPVLREIIGQLADAGADAAIVSDLGAAMAMRQQLPSLHLHASTQMAVHNRHGVRFLRQSGFERCVLARELTFAEIADCAEEGLALEAFCHGALCVSCSGQCLFSSLVGGRSGNRGMCAQPCRLPYKLAGPLLEVSEASGHLLSPKDLMSLFQLDALRRAGVASLKIEGRLKRPEYVAVVTRAYREALLMDGLPPETKARELMQIFNRGGFTQGYGFGARDAELMFPERPNHCGVRVGAIERGRAVFDADVPVDAADQIVIRRPGAEDAAYRGAKSLPESGELFRLADDRQLRAARETYEGVETPSIPLHGRATIRVGQRLRIAASCGDIEVEWIGGEVQRAQNQPTTEARVKEQLRKTGGTPYFFETLDVAIDEHAFVSAAQLNAGRREQIALLSLRKIERARGCARESLPPRVPELPRPGRAKPKLIVQSGDAELLSASMEWGADGIVWQPDELTPDVLASAAPSQMYALALPMVCSDADLINLHQFATANAERIEGVLLSNPAHLALTWPGQASADFALNIANDYGAAVVNMPYTPSVELTADEIEQLGGDRRLVVYGRLPLMMLRHCPLAARLNPESMRHADCHRCDRASDDGLDAHRLIDRKGVAFPLRRLRTSNGCIVRVLNSVPLMLLRHIKRLPEASAWRLIFEGESQSQAEAITRLHRAAIDGIDFKAMDEWKHIEPMESTTGHYFRGVE